MIVSVHIPKTAGSTFHNLLRQRLGDRVLYDNGDWPEERSDEALAYQARRRDEAAAKTAELERDHDVIHGHFTAAKYRGIFAREQLVTFLRDPYQRAVSMYEHALRTADSPHPRFRVFRERQMSCLDLIAEVPNQQSLYMAARPLDDFAMIGITERFEGGLALFASVCGIDLERNAERWNTNPDATPGGYPISAEIRRQVERYQADDLQLYAQASAHFEAELSRRCPMRSAPDHEP